MTRFSKALFLHLFIFCSLFINAQSGFELIKNNDYFEAKKAFKSTLEKDSVNFDALTGMVILSEISQEYLEFEKYVNTLLRNNKDPYTFALFNYLYHGDYKSIEKQNYPDWVTVKYKLDEAITFGGKNRDRAKLWEKYNAIMPKGNWSMIGPFKNINGSGFVIPHEIENEGYSDTKFYTNNEGVKLNWVTPLYSDATGRIVFSQHLPDVGYGDDAVYYANTFINCDADKTIQLQIGRSAAVKIWVNDIQVYENNHTVPFFYDMETVQLQLKKGNNRILIKNATQKNTEENTGTLYFWDGNSYEHDMLAIRFTETEGKPIANISSSFDGRNYNAGILSSPTTTSHSLVDHFKDQAVKGNNPWFDYCLLKSFLSENYSKQGEEYFSNKYKVNSNIVFYKYLFAKMCQFNGKSEKVYELLSKIDERKTPFFGLQFEKLQEINLDTDPEKYFLALQNLSQISPSNFSLLSNYVDYYNKTGKQTEKDTFINQCIRKYPVYKDDLESSLSNYKEKEERHGPAELLKTQKKSIKALKTGSQERDIDNAIEYYKDRKKKDKVIALYKDKIYFTPHICSNYNEFADYLKEIEKYDEAQSILKTSLKVNPYQSNVYESLGDIAKLKGSTDSALFYYYKGKSLGSGTGLFGYKNGIPEKIEQIVGAQNFKKIFTTPTFDQTLNNPEWETLAQNEDAIILQYTKDCVLDTNNTVSIYQSLMIKIVKESGIEKYNEFDMSFMGDITSAKIIKANGTESTPEKSGSYVVIKNLEAGDLIKIEGQAILDAETIFGKDFNHQHFIFFPDPVFYSKFDFSLPKGKYLGYKTHKMESEPKKFTDSFGYDHYVWQNNNLEKIQDESAFPDYYDLYRSVSISTIKNWETVNDWYEQTTYQKTDLTYEIKEILDTLIKPGMTDAEKVQKIYNYITTKIRYSYVAFLNTRFVPKWPGNTASAGIGDCKDVATLMITMLKAQNIETYYTLVKTNQYNRLEPVPSLTFDHVIVCYVLNGVRHYCDLTTNFYPLYVLPEMDNNAFGLLVKPGEKEVFHLPNDLIDASKTNAKYTIDADLFDGRDLKLSVAAEYTGTAGGNLREQIFRTPKNKYSDFASQYFGQDVFENSVYEKVDFTNSEDFSNPLKVNYSLIAKGFADKVSGLYIIRMPYLEAIRKNQVILENKRTNRVDLEKVLNIYPSEQIINLKIPAGYKLAEFPQNIDHNSIFSNYSVHFKATLTGLQIIKKQQFFKTIIEINEFELFKADYLKLLDLDKFKIALVKK